MTVKNPKENSAVHAQMEEYALEYKTRDEARELIIGHSRKIIKPAKQAIYALHREDFSTYDSLIAGADKEVDQAMQLNKTTNMNVQDVGALRAALEELIEAKAYAFILKTKQIPTKQDLNIEHINTEIYLQGLSDCSGELVRRAVSAATKQNLSEVQELANIVEEIQGLFLLFDFRGGELRKKSDMLRHNLNKIQTIVYEVSLRK